MTKKRQGKKLPLKKRTVRRIDDELLERVPGGDGYGYSLPTPRQTTSQADSTRMPSASTKPIFTGGANHNQVLRAR